MLFIMAGCSAEPETPAPPAADEVAPSESVDEEHPQVRIETNVGAITLQLDALLAPVTVRNFLNYVSEGYYQETLFHYVEAGTMILGGGYSAEHQRKPPGFSIRNEAHNGLKNLRGTIAMARDAGLVDSATSQFFIHLKDASQLDHTGETAELYGYCVFGKVIEGLEIVDRISQTSTQDLGGDLVQLPQPAVIIQAIRRVR